MKNKKIVTVLVAAAAAVSLAMPAVAQSIDPVAGTYPPAPKKKGAQTQVAMASRTPVRITVHKRSYLDPGTETKTHQEHYQDYAFPPGSSSSRFSNDYNLTFERSPLPTCFDLPGFCR